MSRWFVRLFTVSLAVFGLAAALPARAGGPQKSFRLAVTTSFENSGLSHYLLPKFTKATGIRIELVVVGTGQALKLGQRGDVDAILVHAKPDELKFVKDGHAVARHDVMYNDFILVGPRNDPAKIKGITDIGVALSRIRDTQASFLSRGDNSGTHKKEISLWKLIGIDARTLDAPWYRRTGSGMGATLNVAAGLDSYTMVDRGTWLSFKNKRDLDLLFAGSPALFNQYGILVINPERHRHVRHKEAMAFQNWILSAAGQKIIATYRVHGEQLFMPNSRPNS